MTRAAAIFVVAVLTVCGCASGGPPVADGRDACLAYGFSPGSAEYRLCREREAATRAHDSVARRPALAAPALG